ncbi:MAG: Mu-like prophage major head subunit gpT family protein [Thiotrichales bacterium]|jgi:phage major head subunit gpT-like protein|nr:Mu-like prophage major head subunit gpT family protein [Thiotrichales bacterium]
MAIVTAASLQALRTAVSAAFKGGLSSVTPQYQQIATVVPSSTASNTYGWLGDMPGMREWIGDREINDIKENAYSIANKDFEATVGVKRTDIEDDNLGIYTPMFTELGRSAAIFPDQLVFELLKNGFTNKCYDGKNFFDANHKRYPKADGTGTAVNVSNVIVDDAYTGDAWYLLCTNRAIKPLIFQDRKSAQFVAMNKMDDEAVFTSNQYRFGVDMRCNVGYGFWQMAFAVKAELNAENLKAARAAMRGFKADGGKPLAITPDLLVVPTSLEDKARILLEREMTSEVVTVQTGVDASGNPVYAKQTVSVSNDMKGAFGLLIANYL